MREKKASTIGKRCVDLLSHKREVASWRWVEEIVEVRAVDAEPGHAGRLRRNERVHADGRDEESAQLFAVAFQRPERRKAQSAHAGHAGRNVRGDRRHGKDDHR